MPDSHIAGMHSTAAGAGTLLRMLLHPHGTRCCNLHLTLCVQRMRQGSELMFDKLEICTMFAYHVGAVRHQIPLQRDHQAYRVTATLGALCC